MASSPWWFHPYPAGEAQGNEGAHVRASGPGPLAALEAGLAEVRRKVQLTDDLIDQIVYKLYGLTEEEIAIVEGRG